MLSVMCRYLADAGEEVLEVSDGHGGQLEFVLGLDQEAEHLLLGHLHTKGLDHCQPPLGLRTGGWTALEALARRLQIVPNMSV